METPKENQNGGENKPVREKVYHLVDPFDLYSDKDGTSFMNIRNQAGDASWVEVQAIRSSVGRSRLIGMYHHRYGQHPNSQGLKEGIDALEAQAHRVRIPVGLRTISHGDGFVLDLCDDRWRKVVVRPGEWGVSQERLPPFQRGPGAAALPFPIEGGSVNRLRPFLNIGSEENWWLVLGWLVYALQPRGPYPILVLQGEQGSSKSTVARTLVGLIDPNEAPLISMPKTERELMVIAKSRHALAFDNVSGLSPDMKDALCRLATGGGHATRKLYSDHETIVWTASRPIILNGIDSLLVADDLADRAISITLPYIPESQRVRESDLKRDFERVKFEILGALLDAAALALQSPHPAKDVQLPRMADFAHFAAATCGACGIEYKQFLDAYKSNRRDAVERGLDTDPLARAIRVLMMPASEWQGTCGQLLRALAALGNKHEDIDSLPSNARGLGSRLRRIAPALRSIGIEFTDLGRGRTGYQVSLRKPSQEASAHCEHGERSTLLNLEEEKKKRERSKNPTRSRRSPPSPAGCSDTSGGEL